MAIVESDPLGQRPELIHLLKKGVGDYIANDSVQKQLHDTETEAVGVASVFAAGKTAVVDLAIPDNHPRLKKIDTVTNRNRKASDPRGFLTANEGITLRSLSEEIKESMGERHDTVRARLPESINSLEFALDNMDLFTFVYNEHGEEGEQAANHHSIICTRNTRSHAGLCPKTRKKHTLDIWTIHSGKNSPPTVRCFLTSNGVNPSSAPRQAD
jgi:hypothetical protein